MIEHVKVFYPGDGKALVELHVGIDGVKKLFFDEQDKSSLVVLTEDNIVTYHGFLFVCGKAYKKEV